MRYSTIWRLQYPVKAGTKCFTFCKIDWVYEIIETQVKWYEEMWYTKALYQTYDDAEIALNIHLWKRSVW